MEGEFGSQGRQRDPHWSNLPGSDRDLGTGRGRKRRGGGHRHGKRCQTQAHGAGRRDERREMACGEYGRRPGGWCFAPGEDVRSGCKHIKGYDDERLLMGGGSMEEGKEKSSKTVKLGGTRGLDKSVTISTEYRCGGVTVGGWDTATSQFGHTSRTGGQLHTNMTVGSRRPLLVSPNFIVTDIIIKLRV